MATALLAGTIGYFIGTGSSLGIFPSPSSSAAYSSSKDKRNKKSWPNSYDVNVHLDSSDEELMAQQKKGADAEDSEEEDSDEEEGAGALKSDFEGHENEEVKLVLCVRTDLGMGKGACLLLLYFAVLITV